MRYLFSIVCLFFCLSSSLAFAERYVPTNLDCSPKALKQADLKYQELVKPMLSTLADSYNDKREVLETKEQERAIVFRNWMRMRCTCKVAGMSLLEKTLCQALSSDVRLSDANTCLMRN